MYDLNATAVFLEVVSAGSFVKAAKKVRLPTSTVSDKIHALEASLGVTLISRTTRSMNLTDAGQLFLEGSSEALLKLQEAFHATAGTRSKPSGTLRFSVPLEFAYKEITEVIRTYRAKFPEVHVEVFFSNELVDFEKDGIDFAVRGGHLKDSSLVAKKLGYGQQILLASEDYLRRSPSLQKPKDLEQHLCIGYLNPKDSETELTWTLRGSKDQQQKIRPRTFVKLNSFEAIQDFVEAAEGVAFIPESQLRHVWHSKVKRVLPDWSSGRVPVQIVYPKHRLQSAKVREMLPLISDKLSQVLAIRFEACRVKESAK